LSQPDAVRVLNTSTLFRLARSESNQLSRTSLERWIRDAVSAGRLIKVVRGLYLNHLSSPPTELCEAAMWLRPGAVVSLQTVLGDAGVWNNFTSMATAVVPFSPDLTSPSLGIKRTNAGEFAFRGLPKSIIDAGKPEDRLVDRVDYLRATPEAALLHWLYLANSPRSNLSRPPLDLQAVDLKTARLNRLAKAMGIENELRKWIDAKRVHDSSRSVAEKTWIPPPRPG
jgi:hypothetical protein